MLRPYGRFLRNAYRIIPDHDGQAAFVAGKFEVKVEEMFGAAEVRGHVGRIADFDKTEWLVEGGEFVNAGEPEGTAVLLLQFLNDGAGYPLFAPRLDHSNGSQLAGTVPVGFDLTAADDTAVFIHGYNKPLPLQAKRIDAHFLDQFFDGRLVGFDGRTQLVFVVHFSG